MLADEAILLGRGLRSSGRVELICAERRYGMSANRVVPVLFRLACLARLLSLASFAYGQDPAADQSASITPLIRQMVGMWHVRSRMWSGPEAKAVDLPPAMARREIVGDAFLEEVMEAADKSGQASFTRVAYF